MGILNELHKRKEFKDILIKHTGRMATKETFSQIEYDIRKFFMIKGEFYENLLFDVDFDKETNNIQIYPKDLYTKNVLEPYMKEFLVENNSL